MTSGWRAQAERGSPLAVRTILWIALRIGRPVARLLLYPICLYFLLTGGTARRASRDFLRHAGLPRAGTWHVFRHLHTFSAVLLDRVYFLNGETERFDVRIHLDEPTKAALDGGQGAVLLGSHLGSFDALRALALSHRRLALRALMHHDHNRLITQLLEALDPRIGETVIPLGRPDSLLRSKEWVDQGGTVALLADRADDGGDDPRRRLVRCSFLGGQALLPSGPLRLAATLDVPVMLFFGIHRGGKRYDVHLEWFADRGELSRDPDRIAEAVRRYAERLETYALDAPYNWFNFFDFWAGGVHPGPRARAAAAR
jgi:predicted LPLAT superfamily acyltransferase